jgi:hypothetical protein
MFDYLSDARLKEKLIYTDTDSIFLSNHCGEINESVELGGMKLEDNYPVDTAFFIKPKLYYTTKLKCKGIRYDKKDEKEIVNNIINQNIIPQDRFIKLRTALRSQEHHKLGKLQVNQVIQMDKLIGLTDNKRVWSDNFDLESQENSTPIYFEQ